MSDFNSLTCPTCGVQFGFLPDVERSWKESHKQFFCPNGHPCSWKGEDPEQIELKDLRVEVKELKGKLTAALEDVEVQKKKVEELELELEIWKPSEKSA